MELILFILLCLSIAFNTIQFIAIKHFFSLVSCERRKQLIYKTEINMPQRDYEDGEQNYFGGDM